MRFSSICLFASALLLFLVEPMVAKLVLPLVGGTSAVWATSVLLFQTVLLIGYGYPQLARDAAPVAVVVGAAAWARPARTAAGPADPTRG